MKLSRTIALDVPARRFHIPAALLEPGIVTLCGLKSRETYYHDAEQCPPDCPDCLVVLHYCKDLEVSSGTVTESDF